MPFSRGRRLLSLDGGGIRGISELYMLQEMMERLKIQNELVTVPRPCEWFDMMAGSNTGGIIALLLGRLHMSVEEAIIAYSALSREVFSDMGWLHAPHNKAHRLEEVLKDIIQLKTGDSETKMMTDTGCRVFVCAMSAHNIAPGMPRLFRTYVGETGMHQSYNCTIWEAARATCACPRFFGPIQMGPSGLKETFVDGGLGCNNPLDVLFREAHNVFPDYHLSCIISLGTGLVQPASARLTDLNEALLEIARDCEGTADTAEWRFRYIPDVYYRFTVVRGLESIENDDWSLANTIKAYTQSYLNTFEAGQRITAAVKSIGAREVGRISTKQLVSYVPSLVDNQSIRSTSTRKSSWSIQTLPQMTATYLEGRRTNRIASNRFFRTILTPFGTRTLSPEEEFRAKYRAACSLMERNMFAQCEPLLRGSVTLARLIFGFRDATYINAAHDLAKCVFHEGRYREAAGMFKDVLKAQQELFGQEHPEALITSSDLACSIAGQGLHAEAVEMFDTVLAAQRTTQGDRHPDTLRTRHQRALSIIGLREYPQAERELRTVLFSRREVLGDDHRDTVTANYHLAFTMLKQGNSLEAEEMCRSAWTCLGKRLGNKHIATLDARVHLAFAMLRQGRPIPAETVLREIEMLQTQVLGDVHPDVLRTIHYLALALRGQRRYAEACSSLERVLVMRTTVLGSEHPDTLETRRELDETLNLQHDDRPSVAKSFLDAGQYDEAEMVYREILAGQRETYGADDANVLSTKQDLAYSLFKQARYTEAAEVYKHLPSGYRMNVDTSIPGEQYKICNYRARYQDWHHSWPPQVHVQALEARDRLANSLFNQRNYKDAEKAYAELLAERRKRLGTHHQDTLRTQHALASSLFNQRIYAEALTQYSEVLEACKVHFGDEHPDTLETQHGLANSCLKLGRFEQAEKESRAAWVILSTVLGNDHLDTVEMEQILVHALNKQKDQPNDCIGRRQISAGGYRVSTNRSNRR